MQVAMIPAGIDLAITDKIEQTISANGVYCRNCVSCVNREVLEPGCKRYVIEQKKAPHIGLGYGIPARIPRFCSNCRAEDGDCKPEGRGYELYVPPKSIPDTPKDRG